MIDAIHESDTRFDEGLGRMVWDSDGRVLSGTVLIVKDCEFEGTVVAGWAEIVHEASGVHVYDPVHANEVHPFFAGYMMANPWQRVGQSAYNAVDIVFPGLLRYLPDELDIFEVEETDDDRYIKFWTWVATRATEGHPVTLHASEEGLKASWS
jgi:hypothetical protein